MRVQANVYNIKQSNRELQGYQENNQKLIKNNQVSSQYNQTWIKKQSNLINMGIKHKTCRLRRRPRGAVAI